ncbi:MAG TPA: fatty acid desaturase, partial [Beijerinckiaceae bacterium]|nr:fatty acid desaturase [Beijerinckiaceae bacterium]
MNLQTQAQLQEPAKLEDSRALTKLLLSYSKPSGKRSAFELCVTGGPFVASWICAWASLRFVGFWLAMPFMIAAAGFLVRLFMIQHDCGHGAFFRNKQLNDWAGRVISVFTMTPYDFWRRSHAIHHATSGNLDARGIGDVDTLTVGEYLASSRWGRLKYRLYRNPFVMFGIGPSYLFLVRHRLPAGMTRADWRGWLSPLSTNLCIAVLASGAIWAVGLPSFLLVHLPIMVLAASA